MPCEPAGGSESGATAGSGSLAGHAQLRDCAVADTGNGGRIIGGWLLAGKQGGE